jgi:hypothetical protein
MVTTRNHGVYLHITDALLLLNFQIILTIVLDVKNSYEVICQSKIHYIRMQKDIYAYERTNGQENHFIRVTTSSVLPCSPLPPRLSPPLPQSCLFLCVMPALCTVFCLQWFDLFSCLSIIAKVTHLSHIDSYPGAAQQTL